MNLDTLERPLFFVHIQKTAGGTLRDHLRANLPFGALYPEGAGFEDDPLDAYWTISRLVAIAPERRRQIRAYVGHFPYVAVELLGEPVTTMTVLRDPVDRTISYLKMRSQNAERAGLSFEEIYEHPFDFPAFIHNHQTKILSMTVEDEPETFMDTIVVDRDRLERAKRNLEKIDLLGLQEHFDELLDEVECRFGWELDRSAATHVGVPAEQVSDSFRRRIAEDNAIDAELFEFAQQLYRDRTGRG